MFGVATAVARWKACVEVRSWNVLMTAREPSRTIVSGRGRSVVVRSRGRDSGAIVVVFCCDRTTITKPVVAVGAC